MTFCYHRLLTQTCSEIVLIIDGKVNCYFLCCILYFDEGVIIEVGIGIALMPVSARVWFILGAIQ